MKGFLEISKKVWLSIFIFISLVLAMGTKTLNVSLWLRNGFDVSGYHPDVAFYWLIGTGVYFTILYLTPEKENYYFWVIGTVGFVYTLFLLWGTIQTYGGISIPLIGII